MIEETKARRAGLEAAIAAICETADKMSRAEWRAFCGATVKGAR